MENLLKLSVKDENELKKEAKKAVCALLNSNGGKLIINTELKKGNEVIRLVEQTCESFLNTSGINEKLIFKRSKKPNQYIWEVKRGDALCTMNYNLYLPTDAQKKLINPLDYKAVNKILDTGRIVDVTQTQQDVPAEFILNDPIGLHESRTVQFKHLKSENEGGSDLASRLDKNGLNLYVSAFANHCGGRLYCGINDKGKVMAQIVKDKDQEDLTSKISKYINKTIWPEYCGKPQRGRDGQWDITFEPVKDEEGNPIPSTFVIVISIAPCPGGVFTSKPESYHIVDGKVKSMAFAEWKRKYLNSARELESNKALRLLPKCDWSSMELKLTCDSQDWKLLRMINNGQWNNFTAHVTKLQNDTPDAELRLVLLTKRYMFHYRKDENDEADNCIAEFDNRLPTAKDVLIFNVKGRLVRSARERSRGNHNESYKIAKDCLQQVEQIAPCISTVEFYVHFGTMLTIMESTAKDSHDLSEEDLTSRSFKQDAIRFFDRALEHLQEADYVPSSKADKQQKTLIHLAFLHLGCSLSGHVVDDLVSEDDIKKAKTCIDQARDSDCNSIPMSSFRECHLDFAESCFYYRRSQLEPSKEKRIDWLERALRKVAEAQVRATRYKFVELSRYAETHTKVFEKELETL